MLGTRELNKALQERLNPNIYDLPEKANMGAIYRVGDRIMQVKNNYDMDWEKETQTINSKGVAVKSETNENMNEERNIGLKEKSVEVGKGVFNGEIGTITEVSEKNKIVKNSIL